MTPQEKFHATRTELGAALIERDDEIDLALTALISQENVLLVGPPGTAKSLLADSLVGWMSGSKFSICLNRYTVPEEMFGPISLVGLKADDFRRVVDGYLPSAEIAFLDEIWKGSSAILNSCLKVLNEKEFSNGSTVLKCPLRLAISASNEWPTSDGGKDLSAMFDRFLFRKSVRPIVTESGRERLLFGGDHAPKLSTTINAAELDESASEASRLLWGEDAKDALRSILHEARREGVVPGDRRQYKSIRASQAYAWLSGAAEVQPGHLEILTHVLWDDPAEQPSTIAEIVGRIANPVGMRVNKLLAETAEIIASADLQELSESLGAAKKLKEIHESLKVLNGDPRAAKARDYVSGEIKRIRLACVDRI